MALNLILGFALPWGFGIYLYRRDRAIFLVSAPFASVWAFLINSILFNLNFDRFIPLDSSNDLVTMSVNLGLYPVLGSYLVYLIKTQKISPYLLVLIFSVFTTGLEYLGLLFHIVSYQNGWNIGWTFLSYVLPYLMCYWYYRKLNQLNIF